MKIVQQIFPRERPLAWDVLVESSPSAVDARPADRLSKRVRAQARLKHRLPPEPVEVAKRRKLMIKQQDPSIIETDQWKTLFKRHR